MSLAADANLAEALCLHEETQYPDVKHKTPEQIVKGVWHLVRLSCLPLHGVVAIPLAREAISESLENIWAGGGNLFKLRGEKLP
jgi:hypothetical protein